MFKFLVIVNYRFYRLTMCMIVHDRLGILHVDYHQLYQNMFSRQGIIMWRDCMAVCAIRQLSRAQFKMSKKCKKIVSTNDLNTILGSVDDFALYISYYYFC